MDRKDASNETDGIMAHRERLCYRLMKARERKIQLYIFKKKPKQPNSEDLSFSSLYNTVPVRFIPHNIMTKYI